MAGMKVARDLLDMKSAEAILAVRNAFEKVETIEAYLATVHADEAGGDPFTREDGEFRYTADEAYLLRYLFSSLDGLRSQVQPLLDSGRQLTGLS